MPLSPRQQRVYEFIKEFTALNSVSPMLSEIAKRFGYSSTTTVHVILQKIEREGLITRTKSIKRGIRIVGYEPEPEYGEIVHCPVCDEDLYESQFGICRARKSGRNLYCKVCIRAKVTKNRKDKKPWIEAQKKLRQARIDAELKDRGIVAGRRLPAIDRVRDAIQLGAKTQQDIGRIADVKKDELGEVLSILLLWNHEIKTRTVGETRIYFPAVQVERKPCTQSIPLIEFAMCFGPRVKGVAA